MTKIFTKADIEFEHFGESVSRNDNQHNSKLFKRLEELKSQDIYIVDVTLLSSHEEISSLGLVFNRYMIRFVRPKYEVKLSVDLYNSLTEEYEYYRSKDLGFFKTVEEVEEIKKEYISKNTHDVQYTVDVTLHSPLDQEL